MEQQAGEIGDGRVVRIAANGADGPRAAGDAAAAFVSLALLRRGTVGAVLPSSRRLARKMADSAAGCAALIELGAGTGAITAALRRRHPDVPLIAVEMEPRMARHLRRRFPGVDVREDTAHRVLAEAGTAPPGLVLVSSLPFRSLPPQLHRHSTLAIELLLCARPDCRLLQYSYLPREPFALHHATQLRWRRVGTVWGNAPPAWVWELKARDGSQPTG